MLQYKKTLVITIIVMLVLAGVSINAIIGDNGVITNAQRANLLNSCAVLEEFLQEYYVGKIDNLPQGVESKIEAIQKIDESKNWIYDPRDDGYGTVSYAVDSEDNALYLIRKSQLPEEIRKELKGGDANSYYDYVMLKDVYGVTRDLKVYYCPDGKSSMLAMSSDKLDKDNPQRAIFDKSKPENVEIFSILSRFDSDGDKVLTLQEIKGITNLTITAEDNITRLAGFENLSNLKNLTLDNVRLESLDGISGAILLETIQINNSVIGNYDDLGKNKNLTSFKYLADDNEHIDFDTELKKICGANNDEHIGISKGEFSKLKTFGVYGDWGYDGNTITTGVLISNLTDISCIENLSNVTKSSIKKLYFQNNPIISIDCLDGFGDVEYLNIGRTNIFDLKGIENLKSLKFLDAYHCNNLGKNDLSGGYIANNALSYIKGCVDLEMLQLFMVYNIKYISDIKVLSKLNDFRLDSDNLDTEDLTNTIPFLKSISTMSLNAKYSLLLTDLNTRSLNLDGQRITSDIFLGLKVYSNLQDLILHNTKIVDENNNVVSLSESNRIVNEVLGSLPLLEHVDMCSFPISSLDFIYDSVNNVVRTPKLRRIDLFDTNVKDYSNLDKCINIEGFSLNNQESDLSVIQNAIARCNASSAYYHGYGGFFTNAVAVLKKLKDCSSLTNLEIRGGNWKQDWSEHTLDLTNVPLTNLFIKNINININLPSTLKTLEISDVGIFPDLSSCSNLEKIVFKKGGAFDTFTSDNVLSALATKVLNVETDPVMSSIELEGMNVFENLNIIGSKFKTQKLVIKNCSNFSSTSGIDGLTDLTTIELTNNSKLKTLTGIGSLSLLTRLELQNCIVDKLDELKTLNNLTYLDLRNNALLYKYQVNGSDVYNLKTISGLKAKQSSLKVYLSGNSDITDWSELSSFSGWWHDSEKAGY